MPEYTAPGVYVEENAVTSAAIEGVSTSTAAFLGETVRGPVRPILVTSVVEYQRWFGGELGADRYLPDAVRGFFANGGRRVVIARVVSRSAATAQADCGASFTLRAVGPGAWGARVFVMIGESTKQVSSPAGLLPVGLRVRVAYYDAVPPEGPCDWFAGVANATSPAHFEEFDNLVVDATGPDGWERWLNGSSLIELDRSAPGLNGGPPDRGLYRLAGGSDGTSALDAVDFQGQPDGVDGFAQGLEALSGETYREVSVVHAPAASFEVARAIIEHCERLRYRFAIIDAGPGPLAPGFDPRSAIADSTRAALYHPWIEVADPSGAPQRRQVPPGGCIAGIYARTDSQRGVHKAPANEIVVGALGLTAAIGQATDDALNLRHVNVIRSLAGRGIRVMGARTLSSDAEWKYVNVRRLLIYLERSIDEGTQWVVFEPNSCPLWTKAVNAIERFLLECWRSGALQGRKPEEAFFVRCDETTMTQDDIANGRLICLIGVAPIKPAEFLIFRVGQRTA
ncbi:MAG: phage tail sheath C-terminal domain-containing protein [Burkholderiaceae bacterium]